MEIIIRNKLLKSDEVVQYLISTCGLKTEKENAGISDLYYLIENEKCYINFAIIDMLNETLHIKFKTGE